MFKPTEEQKKIFHFVKNRKENIVVDAKAGAGKTTTIVQATKLLPKDDKKIFLAFNKHIQEELKAKLPEDVYCYTFHGLGAAAINRTYKGIKFDEFKLDNIIRAKSKKWNLDKELAPQDISNYLDRIKKLVNLCRLTLTMSKKYVPAIANRYDIKLNDKALSRAFSVLEVLINDRKTYDYTDMVFIPAIDSKCWMYQYDYVIVDEIQDLNRAQQKIVEKILKRDRRTKKTIGRFIGIGDPHQSIYGFVGVNEKTFQWFLKFPNTKVLTLSTTFRCAKNIVSKAQEIVPGIKALDNAIDGVVREGSVLDEPMDGDFVLCRTSLPLVKLFFHYLVEGRKATIKGSDIGLSLIEMTNGHKSLAQLMGFWKTQLKNKEIELRRRGILNAEEDSGYAALEDRVITLDFLAKMSKDIKGLNSKIKTIFSDDLKGIILSTVHKSKGLEADRVFIARPDKMPMPAAKAWQVQQEENLLYVAITRAKTELVFDYEWIDDEDEI
jgi:DNA helicase-2/ATP-dependent DNA helicase PcrA